MCAVGRVPFARSWVARQSGTGREQPAIAGLCQKLGRFHLVELGGTLNADPVGGSAEGFTVAVVQNLQTETSLEV
jgi:hypothetical protein